MPESILPRCQRRVRESVRAGSQSQRLLSNGKARWTGLAGWRCFFCVQAPADVSESGMCASSAATEAAASPPVASSLPGAGRRAGGLACTVLHALMVRCARRRRELKGKKARMDARGARKERRKQNKKAKKGGLQRYAAALERTDCNGQGFVWAGLLFAHMNKRANQPFMHMPTRLPGTFCVSCQLAHPPTHRLSCLAC